MSASSSSSTPASRLAFHPGTLKVSGDGVFYSLQGEGRSMGLPSCFLRLHCCNLRCRWCDTSYTWDRRRAEFWSEHVEWSVEQAAARVRDAWRCVDPRVVRRIVVTGGEPLLQAAEVAALAERLDEWRIEIETNGTIPPPAGLLARAQFNCSPKLAHSGEPRARRIRPAALETLRDGDTDFKFVVTDVADLAEIDTDFVRPFALEPARILLMPQGTDPATIADGARAIAAAALERGYRVLGRLHVELWGATRGV